MELRNLKYLFDVTFFTSTLDISTAMSEGKKANNMYDVSMCKGKSFIAISPMTTTDMKTTNKIKFLKDNFLSHSP